MDFTNQDGSSYSLEYRIQQIAPGPAIFREWHFTLAIQEGHAAGDGVTHEEAMVVIDDAFEELRALYDGETSDTIVLQRRFVDAETEWVTP